LIDALPAGKVAKTIANVEMECRTNCHQCLGNMPAIAGYKSMSIESRQSGINQAQSQSKNCKLFRAQSWEQHFCGVTRETGRNVSLE